MTNINIRLFQQEDSKSLHELVNRNQSLFVRYFPITCDNNKTLSLSETYVNGLIEKARLKTMYAHGIIFNTELIGAILVRDIDWRIPKCELSYYLDKNFHGKGIMTNVLKQTINFCFDNLKVNKIFLRVNPTNIGSIKVAEKCGFQREGLLRKDFKIETGELIDNIYFGLLNPELDQ